MASALAVTPSTSMSLRHGHQLKDVAVRVLEITRPPFQSLSSPSSRLQGVLPYESPAFLMRSKNSVELGITHVESMVTVE
jgi:hypothetical protein